MIPRGARLLEIDGGSWDKQRSPFTVAWEITRACPLKCSHCRAVAQHRRHPGELSTEEGIGLIDQVHEIGAKVLVITGGDPLARPDVFDLIAHSHRRGLHTGFSPSVTPRLTERALERAANAGVSAIHLSLDGARPETHDGMRGVRGSYFRTLRTIGAASRLDWRIQIGTTVSRRTVGDLPRLSELLAQLVPGLSLWTLFFLVPTGRATATDVLDADEHESVLEWLADEEFAFPVRTIAAPAYRRILAQRGRPPGAPVNDGNGFAFVSHLGEVYPSGFLQVSAGNVRERPLAEIYRNSDIFIALRDPGRLKGKCSVCEFRSLCGGSRARAWAMSGDPLAEDPTCSYIPRRIA
jgi:radical SAM protein with 4Fe4S-binding SPASM domain